MAINTTAILSQGWHRVDRAQLTRLLRAGGREWVAGLPNPDDIVYVGVSIPLSTPVGIVAATRSKVLGALHSLPPEEQHEVDVDRVIDGCCLFVTIRIRHA